LHRRRHRSYIGLVAHYPPTSSYILLHLQELWFGMGKILTEENWPEVSANIKHLSSLIKNYANRISSQVVRQSRFYNTAQPARSVENASHV